MLLFSNIAIAILVYFKSIADNLLCFIFGIIYLSLIKSFTIFFKPRINVQMETKINQRDQERQKNIYLILLLQFWKNLYFGYTNIIFVDYTGHHLSTSYQTNYQLNQGCNSQTTMISRNSTYYIRNRLKVQNL